MRYVIARSLRVFLLHDSSPRLSSFPDFSASTSLYVHFPCESRDAWLYSISRANSLIEPAPDEGIAELQFVLIIFLRVHDGCMRVVMTIDTPCS